LVLVQYLQLILARNQYEIRTLLRLGHAPRVIRNVFTSYFLNVFLVVLAGSFLVFVFVKKYLDQMFLSNGISLDSTYSLYLLWATLLIVAAFIFTIVTSSKNRIEKAVNT
jgi:hypothetical protein